MFPDRSWAMDHLQVEQLTEEERARTKPEPGPPGQSTITLTPISISDFGHLAEDTKRLVGYKVNGGDGQILRLEGNQLINCRLEGLKLQELEFANGSAISCDLVDSEIEAATFRGFTFQSCFIGSVAFQNCLMSQTSVDSSHLNDVAFSGFGSDAPTNRWTSSLIGSCTFSTARLQDMEFDQCNLYETSFIKCDLQGTVFRKAQIAMCTFREVEVSSDTAFSNLGSVAGTTIHRHTLEALSNYGGLSKGQMMDMNIQNAVGELRQDFSGFWSWAHTAALVLFVAPYLAFLAKQYWVAMTTPPAIGDGETILSAFRWFVVSAGEGRSVSPWFAIFLGQLVYNAARAVLLFKTKSLELKEHITGLPARFEIVGWWYRLHLVVKWGFYLNVALVSLHAWHFLQQRVPYWTP